MLPKLNETRNNKSSELQYPELYQTYLKHEEGHAFEKTLYHFITDLGETDIEDMETLTKKRFVEALNMHKKPVPITRSPYKERWSALHNNIKTILAPLCDLKAVCLLLQRPENHLRVRSNQQIERQVPIRTVADMVNEMEGELTELPKYTAMAKILQGKQMCKGQIKTLKLPEEMDRIIVRWCCNVNVGLYTPNLSRREPVQAAMKKRQERWQLKTGGGQPEIGARGGEAGWSSG